MVIIQRLLRVLEWTFTIRDESVCLFIYLNISTKWPKKEKLIYYADFSGIYNGGGISF